MSQETHIAIRRTVKKAVSMPFESLARASLPEGYELSLVVCGDMLAQRMNKTYRKKKYTPNVLSFPLSRKSGEIFLNIRKAEREARAFQISKKDRIAHLFVHGCAHLRGLPHGAHMDALERRILRSFGFEEPR